MNNRQFVHACCPAFSLRLPCMPRSADAAAPLQCHSCGEIVDPICPQAHLGGTCGRGLFTPRHDHLQKFAVAPIVHSFAGRPRITQNVAGCPTDSEMDVVAESAIMASGDPILVDGVEPSPAIWIDLCIGEPTSASHVVAAATDRGATAEALAKTKNNHYHWNQPCCANGPCSKARVPLDEARLVAWAVESTGRLHPDVRRFLHSMASARAEYESPMGAIPTDRETERHRATTGRIFASWCLLHTTVAARAQADFLSTSLRQCVAEERKRQSHSTSPRSTREAEEAAAAPAVFADLPFSSAARSVYSVRAPRLAASL